MEMVEAGIVFATIVTMSRSPRTHDTPNADIASECDGLHRSRVVANHRVVEYERDRFGHFNWVADEFAWGGVLRIFEIL